MKYYIRLDDACEKRDIEKWSMMETILDTYNIAPLVGVIPKCEDTNMDKYVVDTDFWSKVEKWKSKGWTIALHGYSHVCITKDGGINPVNNRSEFAGVSIEEQKEKIAKGIEIFRSHNIYPKVFFAPSHTFDENTIFALKECSDIRIISDTVANKPYNKGGITFIPQQCGAVRKLPFNTVTFCYHPNTMVEKDFKKLDSFIDKYRGYFLNYECAVSSRKFSAYDAILKELYFIKRK